MSWRMTTPLRSPFPPLALIHTSLSQKEGGRAASTLNTHRQVSLMVSRYTTLVLPLRSCIGPAHEAGLSTGTKEEKVPPRKKEELHDLEIRGRGR